MYNYPLREENLNKLPEFLEYFVHLACLYYIIQLRIVLKIVILRKIIRFNFY